MSICGVALLQDRIEEISCLAVDAERLDLKDDMNEAVCNGEQEIESRNPGKSDTLPLFEQMI